MQAMDDDDLAGYRTLLARGPDAELRLLAHAQREIKRPYAAR
jgi:hypothetical protein